MVGMIGMIGMIGMYANDLLMNSSAVSRQTEHYSEKLDAHLKQIFALAPNQSWQIHQTSLLLNSCSVCDMV